jgi:hypothetical protein
MRRTYDGLKKLCFVFTVSVFNPRVQKQDTSRKFYKKILPYAGIRWEMRLEVVTDPWTNVQRVLKTLWEGPEPTFLSCPPNVFIG